MKRDIEIVQVSEVRNQTNELLGTLVKAKLLGEGKPEQLSSLGTLSFYVPGVVEEYTPGQKLELELT